MDIALECLTALKDPLLWERHIDDSGRSYSIFDATFQEELLWAVFPQIVFL